MSLAEYNKRRDFKKTPEPFEIQRETKSPHAQFVVQKHDAQKLHYDLRLEVDGVLVSWAVPKGPSVDPSEKRLAVLTEDHPLSYADFEGSIPKGEYGAGDVIVWDKGIYTDRETTDPKQSNQRMKDGLKKGELKFLLYGEKLQGGFALVRLRKDERSWLLIKERDDYASTQDITDMHDSVISRQPLPRDTKRSAKKKIVRHAKKRRGKDPMPHGIKPMLATLIERPFDRKDWFFEIKWDGYRAIAEVQDGQVALYSRNGRSFNANYPPITKTLEHHMPNDTVVDGEIIALKDGRVDFHTLQRYADTDAPIQYVVFDLLYHNGRDLRRQPLRERKMLLQEILPKHPMIVLSEHVEKNGNDLFAFIQKEGLEGVVAKDAASPYREGHRGSEWLKVKTLNEQEAIIIGFTEPRGGRKHLGSLVLAAYENGILQYIGHSGGGLSQHELKDLHTKLSKITVKKPPVAEKVPINSPITWVKPALVTQVTFSEWTADGRMRHPIYKGIREDKQPRDVKREAPSKVTKEDQRSKNAHAPRTNTDKIFWPEEGYTKGDVIEYYDRVADIILPHLMDRPQNLLRHPNGITSKGFFHKDITMEVPDFVATCMIWSESNKKKIRYLLCQNKETLLYMANLGCIEVNPWNSRIRDLNKPDYMIFDLDPGGRPFADIITVAQELHAVLDLACQEHYPKTSGKTGLHVAVPLGAQYGYEQIKDFAELIMHLVHRRVPDITSIERSPAKRKNKIYLDYLQNRRAQTLACAYSLRPFPGATVSTPLEWREVRKGLDPAAFTIKTIAKRIEKKGDLWRPLLENRIDLADSIRCLQEHVDLERK